DPPFPNIELDQPRIDPTGTVWIGGRGKGGFPGYFVRLDPTSGALAIFQPGGKGAFDFDPQGRAFISQCQGEYSAVFRFIPATDVATKFYQSPVQGGFICGLAVAGRTVCFSELPTNKVARLDPGTSSAGVSYVVTPDAAQADMATSYVVP